MGGRGGGGGGMKGGGAGVVWNPLEPPPLPRSAPEGHQSSV